MVKERKTLFVRFINNKPDIARIKETLEQIKLVHIVNIFEFKPNKDLVDILISGRNFGSLVTSLCSASELHVVDCEEYAAKENVTEAEKDTENETEIVSPGSRVCPLPDCTLGRVSHNDQPGTVVGVECDGVITVRSDFSGQEKYGYRIGKSKCGNGIKLV